MNTKGMDKIFTLPFVEGYVILGHAVAKNGSRTRREVRLATGTKSWFKEAHIHGSDSASIKQQCSRKMSDILQSRIFWL